jgi:hypothetical protein
MSLQSIVNALTATFNKNVQNLLNYYNSNIKSILNSRLPIIVKNNNIKQLQNYFNTTYNTLKNKLKIDIKSAQAQAQAQAIKYTKNALLIGCNYIGTQYELSGCINDVEDIQNKIKAQYGFNNILIMSDNTSKKPIKLNILNEIKNLLTNSNSGDILFLMFSGHGTKIRDTNSDDRDGFDELFVPLDFNCISDDEIKIIINNNLKKDVTLFALFDCCNSGTVLDLRYQYFDSENYDNSTENTKETETIGNVIMISGCMDNQPSAETYIDSKYQGAMTWSFLDTVNKNPKLSWKDLITNMRTTLKISKYEQIPQLSSGKKLDLTTKFCL